MKINITLNYEIYQIEDKFQAGRKSVQIMTAWENVSSYRKAASHITMMLHLR